MGFSYDLTSIDTGNVDFISAVRFALQDTDEATVELQDEELEALYLATNPELPQEQRNRLVIWQAAQALHRRYAKQASFSSGRTSVQFGERAKYWAVIVAEMRANLGLAEDGVGVLTVARSASHADVFGGAQ